MKALQIDLNATALPGEVTVCQEKNKGHHIEDATPPLGQGPIEKSQCRKDSMVPGIRDFENHVMRTAVVVHRMVSFFTP